MHLFLKKRTLSLVAVLMLAVGLLVARLLPVQAPKEALFVLPAKPLYGPLTKAQMAQEEALVQRLSLRDHFVAQYKKAIKDKQHTEYALAGRVGGDDSIGSLTDALHRGEEAGAAYRRHEEELALLQASLASMNPTDERYGRDARLKRFHEKGAASASFAQIYWLAEQERRAPLQGILQSLEGKLVQIDHRLKELNVELAQMDQAMIYKSLHYQEMPEITVPPDPELKPLSWPRVDEALKLSLRYLHPSHQDYAKITGIAEALPISEEAVQDVSHRELESLSWASLAVPSLEQGMMREGHYALTPNVRNADQLKEDIKTYIKDGASYPQAVRLAALHAGYKDSTLWQADPLDHAANKEGTFRLVLMDESDFLSLSPSQIEALLADGVNVVSLWREHTAVESSSESYDFAEVKKLLVLHQYNKVEDALLEMIQKNPWNAQALLLRSVALRGKGYRAQGLADLVSAAFLAPDDAFIQAIYCYERYGAGADEESRELPQDLKSFVAPETDAPVYMILPQGQKVMLGNCTWRWCALHGPLHFWGYVPSGSLDFK